MEISKEELYSNIITELSSDKKGEVKKLLQTIVAWEEKNPEKSGFQWFEVFGDARRLHKLVTKRILRVVYKTNTSTVYRTIDLNTVKKALADFEKERTPVEEVSTKIPEDIFSVIIGHEDKKDIIRRSLNAENPVHCLLWGSVSSAKTLMLEELTRLPNSTFRLGSRLSSAGLYELLFNERPRYLILDEIDKVDSSENLGCLLSLMERGKIIETKHGKQRSLKLKTWVFAAANRVSKLPPELLSRFVLLRFRDYTDDEFIEVATKVLTDREKIPMGLAVYISDQILRKLKSRDVRDAIHCARLLSEQTREDADRVINILKKQK